MQASAPRLMLDSMTRRGPPGYVTPVMLPAGSNSGASIAASDITQAKHTAAFLRHADGDDVEGLRLRNWPGRDVAWGVTGLLHCAGSVKSVQEHSLHNGCSQHVN